MDRLTEKLHIEDEDEMLCELREEPTSARIPPEWRRNEYFVAVCGRCGDEVAKRNAVAIYRLRKKSSMKILMHLCQRCYENFLDDYGIGE